LRIELIRNSFNLGMVEPKSLNLESLIGAIFQRTRLLTCAIAVVIPAQAQIDPGNFANLPQRPCSLRASAVTDWIELSPVPLIEVDRKVQLLPCSMLAARNSRLHRSPWS
jgi:hypothetical protein